MARNFLTYIFGKKIWAFKSKEKEYRGKSKEFLEIYFFCTQIQVRKTKNNYLSLNEQIDYSIYMYA